MDHLFEHYKKTGYLHHAHVIEGAHAELSPLLLTALSTHLNIETKGNPDLVVSMHDSFGIEDARMLKNSALRGAFGDNRKIFIIGAEVFTNEAQNALLKTFEEATQGTHFFIILPNAQLLLPTLLSRVLVIPGRVNDHRDEAWEIAEKIIDASLEKRFALIKKMSEKKAGETIDRELFRRTLDNIERIFYTRTAGKRSAEYATVFREIFQAKNFLSDRGSSPKMLLEHIAMILPEGSK